MVVKCLLEEVSGELEEEFSLSRDNLKFLRELIEDRELDSFLSWGRKRWNVEPENVEIYRIVNEVMETKHKELGDEIEGILEERGKNEKERIKEIRRIIEDEIKEKMTEIKENVMLREKSSQKGVDFEENSIEILEDEFKHWEFIKTDSRVGDCIIQPRVDKGRGDYEETKYRILLETKNTDAGSPQVRKLRENMEERNIRFGVLMTKERKQLRQKYRPYKMKDWKVFIGSWEDRKLALRVVEGAIKGLELADMEEGKEVNHQKISKAIEEILKSGKEFSSVLENKLQNNIQNAKTLKTQIQNALEDHRRKVREEAKSKVLSELRD